jgi:hypothetical protein
MSEVKSGDRVRIEYEGVVEHVNKTGRCLVMIKREDGRTIAISPQFVTVIEPAYEGGSAYVDNMGRYLVFDGQDRSWRQVGRLNRLGFSEPVRPLRKLVPEDA